MGGAAQGPARGGKKSQQSKIPAGQLPQREKNLFYRHYPEHKEDPDTIVYVLSEILNANPDAMSPAKEQTHDKWARIFQNYVQRMGGEDYQP